MPGCCERALRSRQHHRFTSSCVAQRWQMLQHAQEVQRLRLAASGCGVCRVPCAVVLCAAQSCVDSRQHGHAVKLPANRQAGRQGASVEAEARNYACCWAKLQKRAQVASHRCGVILGNGPIATDGIQHRDANAGTADPVHATSSFCRKQALCTSSRLLQQLMRASRTHRLPTCGAQHTLQWSCLARRASTCAPLPS